MKTNHRLVAALSVTVLGLAACERNAETASAGESGGATTNAQPGQSGSPPATPELRAGLWVVTTETDGMTSTVRMCLDAEVQRAMSVLGHQMAGAMCEENQISRGVGGGWNSRTVCDMGSGGRIVSEGVTTGDMNRAYRTETTSVTTGAAVPHMNGTSTSVMEGRHEGACPAGMSPGDIEAPGGIRFNMMEMSESAARMGPP